MKTLPGRKSSMEALNGKQRRHLRGLGHGLDPVVQVGKGGVTPAVVQAVEAALLAHELIKVRRGAECPADRAELGEALARASGAHLVQILGRTLLLYRPHPEAPRLRLPSGMASGPASGGSDAEGVAQPTRTD